MTNQPTNARPKRWRRFLYSVVGVIALLALVITVTREFWITTLRSYYMGRIFLASEELGRDLPPVDEVEILALDGEVADGTPDSFSPDIGPAVGTINRRTVRGAEAEQIADIWRGIDFDRHYAALCFNPHYALRFRHEGKLILETSVCWHCSTYTLPIGLFGNVRYGFDAQSKEAQILLSALSRLAPHPPASK